MAVDPLQSDRLIKLFKRAALNVPAYRSFLSVNQIDPQSITQSADWSKIPPINKANYLTQYPLKQLLWEDESDLPMVISMSSGSSGQPFYWFRGEQSIEDSAIILNNLFSQAFDTKKLETLVINAFAMGTWIAGTYMFSAMLKLANQGHRLVTITPGINQEEIIKIIEQIGGQFDQIILMGYPPFIKDVIDSAKAKNLPLKELNLRFILAGENISEQWRSFILNAIGKADDLKTIFNMYGTADAGIMGLESPFSVWARQQISHHKELANQLFPGLTLLPTLVEYRPNLRFTEIVSNQILFTIDSAVPLIRYSIKDEGVILEHDYLENKLKEFGLEYPFKSELNEKLPLLALFGRPDVATTFYALNIYPENIKYGLEIAELQAEVTGRFILNTEIDPQTLEQSLSLKVELCPNLEPNPQLKERVLDAVMLSLTNNNSEYAKLNRELGERTVPSVELISYKHPTFNYKIKHQWVKKNA